MDLVRRPVGVGGSTVAPDAELEEPRASVHANCTKPCLYLDSDGKCCSELVTCTTVPEHFEKHGIKDIYRGTEVICRWQGCSETCIRHNFVRHIREKHLGHPRRSAVRDSENGRRQHRSFHEACDEGSQSGPRVNGNADFPLHPCQFLKSNGEPCMQKITYATVSTHFANCHGIKAMSRQQRVVCQWVGCVDKDVRRHSFVRHIREKHLRYTRGSARRKAVKTG
ncbi:hypothetical protein EDC04DRAFT_2756035 [Pisolithus marmoratus]|nr:hypothetical protein EDC04DRAFT_2756035 [Pisolithus marmoratus]